jgi:hypothetical protein
MKKIYMPPAIEIIHVNIESFIAMSGDNSGYDGTSKNNPRPTPIGKDDGNDDDIMAKKWHFVGDIWSDYE